MQMTSIASSSSGNCTHICSEETSILIDAGISCKRITEGLSSISSCVSKLDGIFITHEHSDHIQGLRILSKKYSIPIFATEKTIEAIKVYDTNNEIDSSLYHPILADQYTQLGDFRILPFHNTHDAADPVGYRIEQDLGVVAAVATDLGNYTNYTLDNLKDVDALLLESNHDVRMLEVGSYPYALKRRILSDYGHLSNDRCGQLLCELLTHNNHLKGIYLGHLSKENNYEQLAYETVSCAITESSLPYKGTDLPLMVAKRDVPTKSIIF